MVVGSLDVYFHYHMAPKIFFHNILLVYIPSVIAIAVMHDSMMLSPLSSLFRLPLTRHGLAIMPMHMFRIQTSHCSRGPLPCRQSINTSTEYLNLESALCSTDGQLLSISRRNVFRINECEIVTAISVLLTIV